MYVRSAALSAAVGARIWCQQRTGTCARAATAAASVRGAGAAGRVGAGRAVGAGASGRGCAPAPQAPRAAAPTASPAHSQRTGGILAVNHRASAGTARLDLEDRREAPLEPAPCRAQVQPPDAQALGPGQAQRLVVVLVQAARPVAQRLRVVVAEALGVLGLEARAL